jgi:serine/threonine protein kinase/HAMP domain-containing protein
VDQGLPQRIGKYHIREQIGRGGMGLVYRAFDPALEREVAIKVIHAAKLDPSGQLSRFAAEARALAQLCSPHVVQVFDYHPDLLEPYLVMEYVRGRSLAQVLRDDGPLPLRRLVDCAWQALAGLVAAHGVGILHRDLKPGNILLATEGVYKLADFGLATGQGVVAFADGDLTGTGEIVGTVRYLAPERAAGGDATCATDLYALGVTLYELAWGQHPVVKEDNPLRTAQNIINRPLRPLREVLPAIPPLLGAWFDRLLAHDPSSRFTSASAALEALDLIEVPSAPVRGGTTRRIQRSDPSETLARAAGPASTPASASVVPARMAPEGSDTTLTGHAVLAGTSRPVSTALALPASGMRAVPAALTRKPRVRFVIKLILAIWLFSSAATLIAGLAISQHAITEQAGHFRQELASIAAGAALMIDGEAHRRLAAAGEDAAQDPEFAQVRRTLQEFKDTRPEITHIYTMAGLPEGGEGRVVRFVVDASHEIDRDRNGVIGPDEVVARPGQPYDASTAPQLIKGFETATADEEFITDQWGSWLSGYAPIRDSQGRSTGLVGVDLASDHLTRLEHGFLLHSAVLLGSTLLAFLAAGVLVALRMRRPIVALQAGLLRVAQGDLEATVQVQSADEFRILADAFNYMIGELRDAAAIRRAFEGFVAHSLTAQSSRVVAAPVAGGGVEARLYCDLDQGGGALVDRQSLSDVLSHVLPLLFDAVRTHRGVPERVVGSGVLVVFAAASRDERPQERAVRAALAFLAAVGGGGFTARLAIGIDAGDDSSAVERRAVALGHFNQRLGTDLLVSGGAFLPIRNGFYADRLMIDQPDQDLPAEGYAVKGAVSA